MMSRRLPRPSTSLSILAGLLITCALVSSDDERMQSGFKVELSFPPPNFVFEHPDDVQLAFSLADESAQGDIDIEIDWDQQMCRLKLLDGLR
mmetsp:Transcript_45874/g.143924  ORF Transcript_45874/g.143924 Transcript_45874/m.143924 type:complete len:92 (-) Transcript_45874:232-507(-)